MLQPQRLPYRICRRGHPPTTHPGTHTTGALRGEVIELCLREICLCFQRNPGKGPISSRAALSPTLHHSIGKVGEGTGGAGTAGGCCCSGCIGIKLWLGLRVQAWLHRCCWLRDFAHSAETVCSCLLPLCVGFTPHTRHVYTIGGGVTKLVPPLVVCEY